MHLIRPLILVALVASAAPARAESQAVTVLQNDGFVPGGNAGFRIGKQAGETIAARLSTGGGPAGLIGVQVMFGGGTAGTSHPVTVKIWDDTAETIEPGPELFSMETSLISSGAIQMISLAGVGVPDRFRVGIVLHEDAFPTIAEDLDGTIDVDRNLTNLANVSTGGTEWGSSRNSGASGDWIIRAMVLLGGGGGGGGGGSGGGDGGACFGVVCPAGQFCSSTTQSCTFECVTEDDCGGAFCNGNGQCVGEGAGCCQTGAGGGAAAACLGLGVLAVLLPGLRRRRR
jgi:hypothetical protein